MEGLTVFLEKIIPFWEDCRICDCKLVTLLGESVVLAIITALLLVFLLHFLSLRKEHKGISLFWPFALVWLSGFVIYDVGMYTGEPWSLLGNVPMAVLHAFGMFILESDVSAIHELFHNSGWFMFGFSFVHFLAACISLWFVIKHFGFNIIAALKRNFEALIYTKKSTTYMFWGMNDGTYYLAKSINKWHRMNNNDDYRIIIVRTNSDSEPNSNQNGINRLFNFLSLNNKDMEKLCDLRKYCITSNTFVNLANLDLSSLNSYDIFKELGLLLTKKLIDKNTSGDIHLFFLSEDEQDNIQSIANMKQDCTLAKHKVHYYCHARYNSVNRVIEDIDFLPNTSLHIVDSSHLSIECLKRKPEYQPINFVDIDTNKNIGTVTTPFTCLIIGFGETGKDALRYLYEFGAFVDTDNSHGTQRSKFTCHVVDKQLDSIKGPFLNASPEVFKAQNADGSGLLVNLHAIDCNSDEFYNELLPKITPSLNYVVISTGDDETNITLAVRIFKYVRREGRNFSRLRIFVRSYKSVLYPHMYEIANHYNEGEERIVLFGHDEQLYTYSMIVEDEFEKRGKDYYEAYRTLNPQYDEDGSWEQRRNKLLGLIKLKRMGFDPVTGRAMFTEEPVAHPSKPSLNNLQKLRRKETQDRANAMHESTKLKVLETIINDWYTSLVPKLYNFTEINNRIIVLVNRIKSDNSSKKKGVKYPVEAREQILLDNLAKLEHLRWNASHEVMGYIPMPLSVPSNDRGCDETRGWHNCLIAWEELDAESDKISYVEDYKAFDYAVVETTIDERRKLLENNDR